MNNSNHVKTFPLEFRFFCPANEARETPLTEDEILARLDHAQSLLRLPPSVWDILVEILCPDEGLDAGDPPREVGTPTSALPGTEEKIAVMGARLAAGFALTHSQDATWQEIEEDHVEQVGEFLRNGVIKRTKCKVAMRDGTSIMIPPDDPEEAVEVLRKHFKGEAMRELAGFLWEGIGWLSRQKKEPEEGFLVTGKISEQDANVPKRKKRGRKKKDSSAQLKLFAEPEEGSAA